MKIHFTMLLNLLLSFDSIKEIISQNCSPLCPGTQHVAVQMAIDLTKSFLTDRVHAATSRLSADDSLRLPHEIPWMSHLHLRPSPHTPATSRSKPWSISPSPEQAFSLSRTNAGLYGYGRQRENERKFEIHRSLRRQLPSSLQLLCSQLLTREPLAFP